MSNARNRKIKDFEVKETLEAGIILQGNEVKSISKNEVDLTGARVMITSQPLLIGVYIKPVPGPKPPSKSTDIRAFNLWYKVPEPNRERVLLLNKREIRYLQQQIQKGYRVVPVRLYFKNKKYRVELAVCRPLKKWDHREKEIEQHIKRYESS